MCHNELLSAQRMDEVKFTNEKSGLELCRFVLLHTACTKTIKGKCQYLDRIQVGRVKWHFCCSSVTLCRDSSTLPSAALWNADTAPCSIWPTATPTKRENTTCVQSPLVPALLYTARNIHIHGRHRPRHYLADLSNEKINGPSTLLVGNLGG